MELKLDLHIHSYHSHDGRMTLEEIVSHCQAAGLDGCAVCDHDRVLPAEELQAVRKQFPDFLLIPGTEVSTDAGHLLGWFVTEPIKSRSLGEAAAEIHAQGGLAVLAHPFERTLSRPAPAVPYLDGAEVWNSRAERKNRRANAMAEEFARTHGLRRFAGSDAHVPREIGNAVTVLTLPDPPEEWDQPDEPGRTAQKPDLSAVKAALLAGNTRPAGVRSQAVDTARSQFTRLQKRHAGAIAYCKWALFAVKCCITDLLSARSPRR